MDTPEDAAKAREFGAEGIGLCRTEHMFFEEDRIVAVRQMIVAESESERREALQQILAMQKGDFKKIFRVMDGLPVTVRLLDPPSASHIRWRARPRIAGAAARAIRRPAGRRSANRTAARWPVGHARQPPIAALSRVPGRSG